MGQFIILPLVSMRILITGGSGFIGTNLLEYLVRCNHEVCNFDIAAPRNSAHEPYWHQGDLLDASELQTLILHFCPDVIYHLAARTDLNGQSVNDYVANTIGVQNLISVVRGSASLQRIIFASSRLVCKIGYEPKNEFDYCPTTPYGESKVIGEGMVRNAFSSLQCPAIIVRPTSIWGPWFDIPYKNFFLTIARGMYVHPGLDDIFKSFGFVGNTVYELAKLIEAPDYVVANKMFYLSDYPPINLMLFADSIQRKINSRSIKTVHISLLRIFAKLGDFFKLFGWRNPPLTSFRLNNLIMPMVYDTDPLQNIVGNLPYSMKDGISITVDWLRAQGEFS